jgi:hypothetical protein
VGNSQARNQNTFLPYTILASLPFAIRTKGNAPNFCIGVPDARTGGTSAFSRPISDSSAIKLGFLKNRMLHNVQRYRIYASFFLRIISPGNTTRKYDKCMRKRPPWWPTVNILALKAGDQGSNPRRYTVLVICVSCPRVRFQRLTMDKTEQNRTKIYLRQILQ